MKNESDILLHGKREKNWQYKISNLKIDFQIGYLAPRGKKEGESDIFLHGKKEKKIATTRYPIPNRITSIRPEYTKLVPSKVTKRIV